VQAALSNVARHSKASAVRVFLSMFEDELRLGIEDNGVGFDLERWRHRRNGHGGLRTGNHSALVEISGGRCNIEAIPRHGRGFKRSGASPRAASHERRKEPVAAPQRSPDFDSRPALADDVVRSADQVRP